MEQVPVSQARAELSDLVNRVAYGRERIVLTRHGRAVAAIVSAADLERLAGQNQRGGEPEDAVPHLMVLDSGASAVSGPGDDPGRIRPSLAPAAERGPEVGPGDGSGPGGGPGAVR